MCLTYADQTYFNVRTLNGNNEDEDVELLIFTTGLMNLKEAVVKVLSSDGWVFTY